MAQQEEIVQMIQQLLEKMGWEDSNVSVREQNDQETADISIKTYEARYLIGSSGQNLRSLEHVVRALLHKKFPHLKKITLDINEYRKERESQLRELARNAAQRAAQTKTPVRLPPMSAFERKIVHTELSTRPDVVTESEGEPPLRQIIVKPYV